MWCPLVLLYLAQFSARAQFYVYLPKDLSLLVFWLTFCSSDRAVSPCFAFDFRGKTINFDLYIFRRWTLVCRDSVHLFRRRWSTAIPMVFASLGEMPASRSSASVNPRPSRSFRL